MYSRTVYSTGWRILSLMARRHTWHLQHGCCQVQQHSVDPSTSCKTLNMNLNSVKIV